MNRQGIAQMLTIIIIARPFTPRVRFFVVCCTSPRPKKRRTAASTYQKSITANVTWEEGGLCFLFCCVLFSLRHWHHYTFFKPHCPHILLSLRHTTNRTKEAQWMKRRTPVYSYAHTERRIDTLTTDRHWLSIIRRCNSLVILLALVSSPFASLLLIASFICPASWRR